MLVGNTRLFEAANALVTGEKDVRHRVALACQILNKMHPSELDLDLRARLNDVLNKAGRRGPLLAADRRVIRDRFDETIVHSRNSTYAKYARDIFEIYQEELARHR